MSIAVPPPLNRLATFVNAAQSDPPTIVALKHQLLLTAIGKSPRFRNDLDIVVITQYLSGLESLAHVSPQALHYLATECTSMTLRDGDVFCYQQDAVGADSNALIIIDGSLCGYFNKPFSQRVDTTELFTSWNARQNRKRGVLVDFGDFQTTYGAGALCGFDDLLVGLPNVASTSAELLWYRRKGIHAQEETRAISVNKDTLDRASQRFGLAVERGFVHSHRETASTDISHLAIFSGLSESARQALLQSAPRRLMLRGDTLFGSTREPNTTTVHSVAIVLSGKLDIYWTASVDKEHDQNEERGSRSSTPDQQQQKSSSRPESTHPIFSVRRGQTIGDQSLGLALHQRFDAPSPSLSPLTSQHHLHVMNCLPIRIVSSENTTEVLLIPFALYNEKCTEDYTLQDYEAQLHHQKQLARPQTTVLCSLAGKSSFVAWAPQFFASKAPVERSLKDLYQLVWRLRVDQAVGKAFFQIPPLVLERVCHAMELVHTEETAATILLEEGADPDELYVVAHGALRGIVTTEGAQEVYLPGDIYGLPPRNATAVFADAGTMLLTVSRICIERWLQPVKNEIIINAGSLFQRHQAFVAAHPPRHSWSPEKRKSLTVMARRASSQAADDSEVSNADSLALAKAHIDPLASLFQRMGFLNQVPHFMLTELLAQCLLVYKQPGEVIYHEHEHSTALVVLLSGFLRVFSLENMGVASDMFRQHSFCQFSSLHHLLTKQHSQQNQDMDGSRPATDGQGGTVPSVLTRHRSAMYGIHLQTLHAHNAFRTGVLRDNTQCPATIVAQTPCSMLIIDEMAYSQILQKHQPGIDLAYYNLTAVPVDEPSHQQLHSTVHLAGGQREYLAKLVPQPLLRHIESTATPLTWLSKLSRAKRQLVLRNAKLLMLQPGDRLYCHGDIVNHVVIVVSGALAVYIRQHHDRVANALDASQRSVRSLMLERNVTSNYSTTSHQLSSLDASSTRGVDPRRLQHKRAMLQHKVSRMIATTASAGSAAGPRGDQTAVIGVTHARPPDRGNSSLFVDSVIAAVRDQQRKSVQASAKTVVNGTNTLDVPTQTPSPPPRKSTTAVTFHAAVSRATLAHRLHQRRGSEGDDAITPLGPTASTRSTRMLAKANHADDHDTQADNGVDSNAGSTQFCYLHVGDVYGEEALSMIVYRCPHDVFAESTSTATPSATSKLSSASITALPSSTATVELLCIERTAFLSVINKSDEEVDRELCGRAKTTKSKWQLAEQLVTTHKKTSLASTQKKIPKLFDLFKNILNQRYYLTMRAISEIPMLQDLSDTAKQEICTGARFEAVERFTNVYRDDARGGSTGSTTPGTTSVSGLRYYFVLSGRVGLFPKSAVHSGGGGGTASPYFSNGHVSGKHGSLSLPSSSLAMVNTNNHYVGLPAPMDSCLQEVAVGNGFGEFEILLQDASRHHIIAVALEPTKLLSLPAELFVKYWPQVHEMERNIEYLRNGAVHFFARLEMEKVSSLYHALRNEAYDRGARILDQQHQVPKSEIIFIKDGECSIKHTITLQSLANEDDETKVQEPATFNSRGDSRHTNRSGHHQEIRILATIADVRAGHVFWLDGPGTAPFSLHAISSQVATARITVDKLRAILPKSHLAHVKEHSEMLAARYREQLTNARRTIVRVMNDKRNAELGTSSYGGTAMMFLPSLHYTMQMSNKKTQLQSLLYSKQRVVDSDQSSDAASRSKQNTETCDERQQPPAIPYARVLASKPIDLVRVQAEERAARRRQVDDVDDREEVAPNERSFRWESELDSEYRETHQFEHYEPVDVVASAVLPTALTLRGSFPDDPSLRRKRRLGRQTSGDGDSLPQLEILPRATKIDELVAPETTTTSRVQVHVKLPTATARMGSGRAQPSLSLPPDTSALSAHGDSPTSASTGTKPLPGTRSFKLDYYGDATEWAQLFRAGEPSDSDADFVVDLRATLLAELQSPFSPLRSLKLAPSGCKLHSMGKYVCVDDHGLCSTQQQPHSVRNPRHRSISHDKTPQILSPGWSVKPPRRGRRLIKSSARRLSTDAVTRKQSFLHVLVIPDDAHEAGFVQDQFLRSVVHRQKRRLIVLEDTMLHEYADDTDIHTAGKTSRVLRSIQLLKAEVFDAPVAPPGENDVVLRHSFLIAANGEVVMFTCSSLVEKTVWMQAIRSAAALGKPPPLTATASQATNGAPGSPKFKHRQSVAVSLANRGARRSSMLGGPTNGGRNAVVQEEVLEVEYRIS